MEYSHLKKLTASKMIEISKAWAAIVNNYTLLK